ncbi:MAG: hypothetical protein ACREEM_03590 [Blastocatellia bacterium]
MKTLFLFCLCLSLEAKGTVRISNNSTYSAPVQIGVINDAVLSEISGLAPSRTGKGLWWVHNDSGDRARLYVVNSKGALLARFTVTGARNRDWEDLAGGPGRDGKPALYIGDIGDNSRVRDDLKLYRVKEPDLSKGATDGETETAEAFPFRYPDGRHDAESLIVDPKSGRPYIVTKTFSPPCGVYRFPMPLRAGQRVTLEKVEGRAVEPISKLLLATGAAASPDGKRVIVRTYFTALEMTRADGGSFDSLFNSTPTPVKIASERQGEAISYSADGKSIITTSEKVPAPIHQIKRSR